MKYLLEKEERILLAVLRDSKSAERDYMLIDLILNTGLRLNEIRNLNIGDVKEAVAIRSHLIVRKDTAKRNKTREIPLNKAICNHLKGYLSWKAKQGHPLWPESPLFLSRNSNMISKRAVERIVDNWMSKAGLTGYTCHSLRHTFSMKLRRRGVALERIQKLLGHVSLASTGIYTEPSKEDLIEAVEVLETNARIAFIAQNRLL